MTRLYMVLEGAKGTKVTKRPDVRNLIAGFKMDTTVEASAKGIPKINTVLAWCDEKYGALISTLKEEQIKALFRDSGDILIAFHKKFMHMPSSVEEFLLWSCFCYIHHYRTTGDVQNVYYCYVTDVHGSEPESEFEDGLTGRFFNGFMVVDGARDIRVRLSKDYHFSIQSVGIDRGAVYFKEVTR